MAPSVAVGRTVHGPAAREVILSAADGARAPVFATKPWLMARWQSFGLSERTIAVVVNDGDDEWVLPIVFDDLHGVTTAHWLGHPFIDRATVLGGRSSLSPSAAARLAETLVELDVAVELDALDPGHQSTARLLGALELAGWTVIPEACPMLSLGSRVGRSQRNVARFSQRFPSARVRLTSGSSLTQAVVSRFLQRRHQRWQSDGRWDELPFVERQSGFADLFAKLIELLAEHESARLFQLEVGATVMAEDLYLGTTSMPLLYFRTYDRAFAAHSPGRVLLDQYIVRASGAGCDTIDLGRGAEQYKFDLGGDGSNVASAVWRP